MISGNGVLELGGTGDAAAIAGIQKDAYLVFDVPQARQYKLKVSGGYWPSETALIALQSPSPQSRKEPSIGLITEQGNGVPKAKSKKASVKKPAPQE